MMKLSTVSWGIVFLITAAVAGTAAAGDFAVRNVAANQTAATLRYWTKSRMKEAGPLATPKEKGDVQHSVGGSLESPGVPGFDPGYDRSTKTIRCAASDALAGALVSDDAAGSSEGYNYPPPHTTFYVLDSLYGTKSTPYPYKAIGKLFLVSDTGRNAYCSAAAIGGRAVLTAGHCISNGNGTYFTKFLFVPAYNDGKAPFGQWAYTSVLTFEEYHTKNDTSRDVGFIVFADQNGETLSEAVGYLGFAYNQDRVKHFSMFGYPVTKPWDGKNMVQTEASYARENTRKNPPTTGIGTSQLGGCSGGPWILGFTAGVKGGSRNMANGVNSVSLGDQDYQIYSPYFDTKVKELKDKAVEK